MTRLALPSVALVIGALPAIAQETTPQDPASLFETFITQDGEDLEACFAEVVEFESAINPVDLETAEPPVPTRILIAVDASGSMAGSAGAVTKMEAAIAAVEGFLVDLPDGVETGLMAFGHTGDNTDSGKAASCDGVEVLAPAGSTYETVKAELGTLSATGWTPLAAALAAAGGELEVSETEGEQVVYVVSDGEETCGGDPLAAARALREGDVRAIVNIIGLDLSVEEQDALKAVAGAGGGTFNAVSDAQSLREALSIRARNIGEMTRIRAESGHITRENNSALGGAMLRINTCIAGIVTRENRAYRDFQQGMRDQDVALEVRDDVKDLLRDRHDESRQRSDRLYAEWSAQNDAANEAISDAADAAEEENDKIGETTSD